MSGAGSSTGLSRAVWNTPHLLLLFLLTPLLLALLGGCATPVVFTVDDGRKVDEQLLAQIKTYGAGERSLRPAIVRSAALQDQACDKQWELPFSVASSQAWTADERVAWVRALGVDERLTVVAASAESPLQLGERIVAVAQVKEAGNAEKMLEALADYRDAGKAFEVTTSAGRRQLVRPLQVCRGYTRFSPPNTPELQDYHWLMAFHPLQIAQAQLSDDEALWAVLWTQGLSEEGGARMKAYHYGVKVVGTLYNLATLASGLKGAALAADVALKVAKSKAQQMVSDALKQQVLDQARSYATSLMKDASLDAAQKILRAKAVSSVQQAAVNRGSLGGVSRVASTVFERADRWAFERMQRLHASPMAGASLHQKLAEMGLASNGFVFDAERLGAITQLASASGLEPVLLATLKGLRAEQIVAELGAMPLASAAAPFSYDDEAEASQPFAHGLVAAILEMPVASKDKK